MDQIIFTEEFCQPENLYPFTLTRQIQDIRVGILTIREKWESLLKLDSRDKKEDDYKDLSRSVHMDEVIGKKDSCYIIHGNILPDASLVKAVKKLRNGEFLSAGSGAAIVYKVGAEEILDRYRIKIGKGIAYPHSIHSIEFPWHIVQLNAWAISADHLQLTAGRRSKKIPATNRLMGHHPVFLEKGATIEHCLINSTEGPVYIGKNALVMEGSMLRGPLAIGEGAVVKMGARIYGGTSIGPYCVVGGEIKNSVIFGFSNKAHDGYLGDSVIGEWCNLGAGTSNSNIRNDARDIRVWTPSGLKNAGQKCGVMMGDHSRTAINSSLNSGTVIGVCCNVFGQGLTPKYIPNFSWGSDGMTTYEWEKALADMNNWKKMKGRELTDEEKGILQYIYRKIE